MHGPQRFIGFPFSSAAHAVHCHAGSDFLPQWLHLLPRFLSMLAEQKGQWAAVPESAGGPSPGKPRVESQLARWCGWWAGLLGGERGESVLVAVDVANNARRRVPVRRRRWSAAWCPLRPPRLALR